ncbi:MAG: type II toxin-antitoxin system HicA family toxin [Pirellulales bacterium]
MPNKLPRVTGEEAVKAFCAAGFVVDRVAGSHHILKHPAKPRRLSIPVHAGRTLGAGLLRSLIKAAGLTVEEFISQL